MVRVFDAGDVLVKYWNCLTLHGSGKRARIVMGCLIAAVVLNIVWLIFS